jgi:hypothetical protein
MKDIKPELIPLRDPVVIEETLDLIKEMWLEIIAIMKKEGNLLAKTLVISFFFMFIVMIAIFIYACKQIISLRHL